MSIGPQTERRIFGKGNGNGDPVGRLLTVGRAFGFSATAIVGAVIALWLWSERLQAQSTNATNAVTAHIEQSMHKGAAAVIEAKTNALETRLTEQIKELRIEHTRAIDEMKIEQRVTNTKVDKCLDKISDEAKARHGDYVNIVDLLNVIKNKP